MGDFDQYANFFTSGMKVGVGIPMPNAEVFRDWALIHDIDEDLVSLQLSRDQLPVNVRLHVGQILELRGGQDGSGYSCRAIIVTEGDEREILLRLIGEIITDELREFYRIDAFLPIKYYIPNEQHLEILKDEWEARRWKRQEKELERKLQRWDGAIIGTSANLPQERHQEAPVEEDTDEAWDTIIPLAANISGGGIRVITHQHYEIGTILLLEMLVPGPRRIVDSVVRVVFATRNYAAGKDQEYYNTAMKYIYIDERDRDAIINHISTVQLKRIRQLRERYLFRSAADDVEGELLSSGRRWVLIGRRAVFTLLFLAIMLIMILYFKHYSVQHPKNEIEETFEGGIRRYLKKLGK